MWMDCSAAARSVIGLANRTVTGIPTPTTWPCDGSTPATTMAGDCVLAAASTAPAGAAMDSNTAAITTDPYRSTLGMAVIPFPDEPTIRTVAVLSGPRLH